MFRGSPDLSADQLANIAAAMGGDFNADTQQTVTRFFFTVPKQDLDVALHIESIRMRNLLATDALWDHERGAIEQEVAGDLSIPSMSFTPSCCPPCSMELLTSTMHWARAPPSMRPRAPCSSNSTTPGTRRTTRSW